MKSILAVLLLLPGLCVSRVAAQSSSSAAAQSPAPARFRELDWGTYVGKVQGAWMGKMVGVTFGQPWEFEYLGTPMGFDITDWTLPRRA
jgi:hypothetical protein